MTTTRAQDLERTQKVREYIAANPTASTAEVVAGMKQQGIDVPDTTVYNIKSYDKRKGSADKRKGFAKPGRRKSKAASNGATAASNSNHDTKSEMTKAEHIRQAFRQLGLRTRPRDVIASLAQQGVTVSSSQVIQECNRLKAKRSKARREAAKAEGPQRTPATRSTAAGLSLNDLLAAKAFVDKIGGLPQAHELLEALEKLR